ncbi:MAG: RNA polymerase sigma factor [Pigmentiphaga sp.]
MTTYLEHYYQELIGFCLRMTRSRDAAEDAVQETYVRVLAAQEAGRESRAPRALLYRTARNLLIDGHRRDAVRGMADPAGPHEAPDTLAAPGCFEPEAAMMAEQTARAVVACIQALPPRCRQAFVLYRFDGLSQAEVAQRMGISRKMVERHVKLGMMACRQALELEGGEASAAGSSPA